MDMRFFSFMLEQPSVEDKLDDGGHKSRVKRKQYETRLGPDIEVENPQEEPRQKEDEAEIGRCRNQVTEFP